jgi:hypothetical protein
VDSYAAEVQDILKIDDWIYANMLVIDSLSIKLPEIDPRLVALCSKAAPLTEKLFISD